MSDQALAAENEPYSVEVKAQAVALVWESGNFSLSARRMRELYPDRPPSRQVIQKWARQADAERFAQLAKDRREAFEHNLVEMGLQASERLMDVIDALPAKDVPIPAGIAIDKTLRYEEIRRRNGGGDETRGPFVIAFIDGRVVAGPQIELTPTIEAEAREISE